MADVTVLVLVGSLRAASINRQLAELAVETAPDGISLQLFDGLGELPFYNEDIDTADVPSPVVALRTAAAEADAALVVTPEYNGSIPGVLKNAIDWASRPPADGVFDNKPVAIQSASTGWAGGLRAQMHLRQVFGFFPMRQLYYPEVVVGLAKQKFDENGKLIDELAIGNITKQMAAFKAFIEGD